MPEAVVVYRDTPENTRMLYADDGSPWLTPKIQQQLYSALLEHCGELLDPNHVTVTYKKAGKLDSLSNNMVITVIGHHTRKRKKRFKQWSEAFAWHIRRLCGDDSDIAFDISLRKHAVWLPPQPA